MKMIDSYPALLSAYEGPAFCLEKWKAYIDALLPCDSSLFLSDMESCLQTGGFTWEADYLPVLNAVASNGVLREKAHDAFRRTTENLEQLVSHRFGKSLDVEIIFYLGLCNGAGWATQYHGQNMILLGIEKIMELNWCEIDDMRGLIYHELGHIYHAQYGVLKRPVSNQADRFLWQLFTEGVAMYFEQALVGDCNYYHQDKNGWRQWCQDHLKEIQADFDRDRHTMTPASQRYFGDWVVYHGHSDVGYYLGCQFVHDLLSRYSFDQIICLDVDAVGRAYQQFLS